jgi:hypothetical protein
MEHLSRKIISSSIMLISLSGVPLNFVISAKMKLNVTGSFIFIKSTRLDKFLMMSSYPEIRYPFGSQQHGATSVKSFLIACSISLKVMPKDSITLEYII